MLRWGEGAQMEHSGQVIIDYYYDYHYYYYCQVIIDPEMGAFGDNGCIDFIRTQWDNEMDKRSLLPGKITRTRTYLL